LQSFDPSLKCGTSSQSTTSVTPAGYKLVWNDEFNDARLDTKSRWRIVTVYNGGSNELQQYVGTNENINIINGKLNLVAIKQSLNNTSITGSNPVHYTSARIDTKGRFEFQYGRVDVCAKLPRGQGMWPAIWLLPTASQPDPLPDNAPQAPDSLYLLSNNWPVNGEIDIMEMIGGAEVKSTDTHRNAAKWTSDSIIYGSLNFGELWPNNSYTWANYRLPGTSIFNDDFHLFSVQWEKNRISWFVDNQPYASSATSANYVNPPSPPVFPSSVRTPADLSLECRAPGTNNVDASNYKFLCPWPFNDHSFYLILNNAVGGAWPGKPDDSIFPQSMVVDYVRIYQ
jgi:beta-glucanase (GH16 family)